MESEHSHSLEEQHTLQEQFEELSGQHQQLLEEVKEEEERRNEAKKHDQIGMTSTGIYKDVHCTYIHALTVVYMSMLGIDSV